MKFKQFIFTLVVMLSSFVMSANAEVANVAKIGETGYATLAKAIAAAQANQTITFVADITENVTVSKSVTIDGAGKTYTGGMTLTNKADVTIKNVNFDGKGYNGYAVNGKGAYYITIEDCTAKNYGYGFVQTASGTALVTVKDVTVSDMNYGVKVDYSNAVVLENVDITAAVAAVLNSNYGGKTITIKDSKLSILGTWKRNNTIKTNYVFEGANTIDSFLIDAAIDNFKLAADATLTAPNEITVTTVEGYEVNYENGAYTSKMPNADVAQIGEQGYESLAAALAAAQAGDVITLTADITEDVTVNKAVTIDGDGKTYTGAMTLKADATIKNLNFDGKGYNGYAITTRGAQYLTIEACTAKNYGYGFVQLASATALTTVKNVTVSEMNYGVKVDYSGAVALENVDITAGVAAVLNSNYGEKTITIKNSKLNILGTWTRNSTIKTNYLFEGANTIEKFIIDAAVDNFKFAAAATLTAPKEITVTSVEENYEVKYVDGAYKSVEKPKAVMIGEQGYETLKDALAAAQAGQTITLAADITEVVEVSKAVTIDGAGKTYTGAMTLKADATIKNVNFDGKGYNGYAITTRGAQNLTIEGCTAKNYGYGFVQLASGTALTTVKNVTVSGMNYGVKVDYSNAVVLENVDITAGVAAVLNSNYGEKAITIKDSKLNILGTWKRNDTTKTTYVFEGANTVATFITEDAIDNFNLAAGATLTAPEGKTVTTVADYEVKYENGTYKSVEMPKAVMIGEQGYATLAAALAAVKDGETITLFVDVESSDIITINKSIALDGNGHTLTYTGSGASARAITVESTANGANLTVKNLTIDCTASYCQRGINYNTTGELTLDNVTVKGTNVTYALNLPGSSVGANVTINNSNLTANIALNVWGKNAEINATDSHFTSVDNSTAENYAAVVLNNDGSTVANGTTVTINGGSITALDENGDLSNAVRNSTSTGTINVSDATTVTGIYSKPVAIVTYGSDQFYSCATLQAAIDKAIATNGSVKLIDNVTASEIITVNAPVVIDGNGKTLTSTAGRAINVDGANGVTIKNLTINASGERAINVINGATNVTVENVTATAANYAVNLAGSAANAVVTVKNSNLTGLNVVNVAAPGAKVTVTGGTLVCNDQTDVESYAALAIATNASKATITATGVTFDIKGDSSKAGNGTTDGTITIDNVVVGQRVAMIQYANGTAYTFDNLAAAVAKAEAGETVKLLADINLSEILVINKAITLDGNEKTLTSTAGRAINVSGANGVKIQNLTINAKGERAINVIQNATNVTIDNVTATAYNYTVNVASSAPEAVVAINNSTLNGLCTVNVAAAGAQVTVDNSTVNCNDNNATAGESYAALSLNKEAVDGSIIATNTTVNVAEGSDSMKGRNGAENGTVTINGSTDDVDVIVAVITYEGSVYYHSFSSLANAIEFAKEGDVITLIRNVTMDYNARDAYETQAQNVVIDGNGKTLTLNQKNSDWASFGLANDSKLVLKNMTIEKTGYGDTSGAWNTHAIIFSCPVEMNNVTVNNSVAVQAGATLNDVTINEANGFYGLWINGNGQAVTVNGGAINATNGGRGIKIADQYIDAPAKVTLNVNGTVFNTAKKAAVLVSSEAGAQITASNVNITKVAEDKVNFVWVDEDWAQYYGNVTVTGAKVRAESTDSFVATVAVGSAVKGYFKTLAAAVEAAPAGATVTLLGNVTLNGGYADDPDAGLRIEKAITIKGNGYTVDCGKFTKGIRVYNNSGAKSGVSFYHITIVNNNAYGRCVDTRSGNIDLLLYTSTLKATGTSSQPLTLGGSERLYRVRMQATTIDAGKSGYGVIAFVPSWAGITASTGSNISGLAAFYLKDGVNGTTLSLDKGTYTGINKYNQNSGVFATVVVEGDNNTIAVKGSTAVVKAVSADGTESAGQAAFLVADGATGNKIQITGVVATEGSQTYLAMVDADVAASTSFTKGGVAMQYVAECGGYKFFALEEAFRFAEDGCTVKLLADVNVDTKNCVTDCGGYSSIFNVEGMELTFDLNGHTITVDADPADFANAKSKMLMGVFTVDEDGKLTIDDSSEAKNGAVKVYANGATVYSLAAAYGKGAQLTINNGSYFVDEMPEATSLIYAQRSESVIINDGTYNIGNVGTLKNGSPWIFNTKGQNVDGIYVYGGTYPNDINHQFWFNEAIVPGDLALKANEEGTSWSVVKAAAYTREVGRSTGSWHRNVGYATIEEAIAATQSRFCEDKVTLAKDVEIEQMITVANGVEVTLDLNGKTLAATDKTSKNYSAIDNRGTLTIVDSSEDGFGKITVEATVNSGWNRYSAVIANNPGGKLTVNGGTIEHLGGTDMAYGIDNLTNGKGTYAETEIYGGTVKSTYRAIRQFLNGTEAQNILTVYGGTLEGANKSIWMQDPSKNANTGTLNVYEDATLKGDVYLTVTAGSTEWPVQAYIEKAALDGESTVLANDNVPADAAALVEYDTFWQVEQKNLAELTIVDEDYAEYINKVEKTVGKLTYVRNFENTEWQTIYLPFEVPVEALTAAGLEAAYIYNASYKNGEARIDHVEMTEGSLAANYPYFVRATEAGEKSVVVNGAVLKATENYAIDCSSVFEKFTFTGTYNAVNADNLDENKGHFVKEGENWETMDEVYAFRVYLTIELRNGNAFVNPQAIRMRSVNANGETTGIDGVDAEQAGDFIFDLHGRRVLETEKGGIYIKGGKKFIAQ